MLQPRLHPAGRQIAADDGSTGGREATTRHLLRRPRSIWAGVGRLAMLTQEWWRQELAHNSPAGTTFNRHGRPSASGSTRASGYILQARSISVTWGPRQGFDGDVEKRCDRSRRVLYIPSETDLCFRSRCSIRAGVHSRVTFTDSLVVGPCRRRRQRIRRTCVLNDHIAAFLA